MCRDGNGDDFGILISQVEKYDFVPKVYNFNNKYPP